MSTLLLQQPRKLHDVQDDIESFVNVVLYHSLRYLDHSRKSFSGQILSSVFDDYQVQPNGTITGGDQKWSLYHTPVVHLKNGFRFHNNRPLTNWVYKARIAVQEWQLFVVQPKFDEAPAMDGEESDALEALADDAQENDPLLRGDLMSTEHLYFHDHTKLSQMWHAILNRPDWPNNDEASDNLPPRTKIPIATPKTTSQAAAANSHQSVKRSLEEVSEEGPVRTKKPKGDSMQPGSSLRQSTTYGE